MLPKTPIHICFSILCLFYGLNLIYCASSAILKKHLKIMDRLDDFIEPITIGAIKPKYTNKM